METAPWNKEREQK